MSVPISRPPVTKSLCLALGLQSPKINTAAKSSRLPVAWLRLVSPLTSAYAAPKVQSKIISDYRLGTIHRLSPFVYRVYLAKR